MDSKYTTKKILASALLLSTIVSTGAAAKDPYGDQWCSTFQKITNLITKGTYSC